MEIFGLQINHFLSREYIDIIKPFWVTVNVTEIKLILMFNKSKASNDTSGFSSLLVSPMELAFVAKYRL